MESAQTKNYGPSESSEDRERYEAARQMHDDRLGLSRHQARQGYIVALVSSCITLVCLIGLIIQSTKADVIPYLVEVEASGQVRLVGEVVEQEWSLGESAKLHILSDWVRAHRSLSSDERVVTSEYAWVRAHSTQVASLRLDEIHSSKLDPFRDFSKKTRTVRVRSTTQLPSSPQAWRVEWLERTYGIGGALLEEHEYVGDFHLTIIKPTDRADLDANPLGVFVDFFDYDMRTPNQ